MSGWRCGETLMAVVGRAGLTRVSGMPRVQQAGDANRDLAANRFRQIEQLSDSLHAVKGDLQDRNRLLDQREHRINELLHEAQPPLPQAPR